MEPPAKRQRRLKSAPHHPNQYVDNDDDDDELSFEPLEIRVKRDSSYRLSLERAQADNRFQATMAHIFEKYGRDFDGIGDEIDLLTGEILVDNGHLQNMRNEGDVGVTKDLDNVTGLLMEDLVHNQDDDLFSSPAPPQLRENSTGEEDDEEDRIMFGRKPDSQSLALLSQPPPRAPDDGLSSLTGLFGTGCPPVYGASPLGFGASPFAMEPWTLSDPFGLSPWDNSRLFPSPTDRYHFPSQDGGSSIWQPGYRFKDDEAVAQSTTPTVLARVRPDVRTKPMKYMLPSSASRPDDSEDQEEIDEDAILMGRGGFSQIDASTSTHMEIDELVLPIPQEVMPPTDTQTDSTTTEADDVSPPKEPRLALTSPEQPTQQRLVVELQALHPSRRHEYASIEEAAADELADDQTPIVDTTKPALSIDDDDTTPSLQGISNAKGLKESDAPASSVLLNEPTSNTALCLSDDEMPISLPKPKAKPQEVAAPKRSASPPAEEPPASIEEATPTNAPSSPTQQVSARALRRKKASADGKPEPGSQQLAPEQSTSLPAEAPPSFTKDMTSTNVPGSPAQEISTRSLRRKKASAEGKPEPESQQLESTSLPAEAPPASTRDTTSTNVPSSPAQQISTRSLRRKEASAEAKLKEKSQHLAPKPSSPPPAEAPPASAKDTTSTNEASSPAQQVSTRALRRKRASEEDSVPASKRNAPPSPTGHHHKTRAMGRELTWLEKFSAPVSTSRTSRRRAVEPTTTKAAEQEAAAVTEPEQNPTTPKEAISSPDNTPSERPATPDEAPIIDTPKAQGPKSEPKPRPKARGTKTPKQAEASSKAAIPKPRTPHTAPLPSQRSILSLAAVDDDDLDDLSRDLFAPVAAPPPPRRTKIWKSTARTREVLRTPVKRRPTDVVSPGSVVKTPGGTVRTYMEIVLE
ncbi:hypothetical protein CP533_3874 [Ophiocordyceps camponoti-saundersi (nom. inval.)]|nr:hypothetical protein CP533_3874 [Ophiocordyceps camponoti-saundersi (nom. inval.)]